MRSSVRLKTLFAPAVLLALLTLAPASVRAQAPDATAPAAQAAPPPPVNAAPTVTPAAPSQPLPDISLKLPHDLSPWGMFLSADIVVKAVMIGLAFASVLTWTIWLAKAIELMAVAAAPAARAHRCARPGALTGTMLAQPARPAAARPARWCAPPTRNCDCRPARSAPTA